MYGWKNKVLPNLPAVLIISPSHYFNYFWTYKYCGNSCQNLGLHLVYRDNWPWSSDNW